MPTKKLGTQLTSWLAELDTLLGRLLNVKHEHKQQNIEYRLKNGIIVSHFLTFSTHHCLAFFLFSLPVWYLLYIFVDGFFCCHYISLNWIMLTLTVRVSEVRWSGPCKEVRSLLGAWGTKQLPPLPGGKWCLCQHHSLINTLEVICLICIIDIFFITAGQKNHFYQYGLGLGFFLVYCLVWTKDLFNFI